MTALNEILIFLFAAYLIGSVPTAFLFGKFLKNVDIRKAGSGNVGATNAFRVLGPKIGIVVMSIDILKGFIPVYASQRFIIGENRVAWLLLVGLAAVLGHMFTIFLNFKGGKGVATTAGVFLAMAPRAMAFCIILWSVLVGLFKMASVGSIASAVALPLAIGYLEKADPFLVYVSVVISALVIFMHRKNIKNLLDGKELKITQNKSRDGEK